MNSPEDFEEFDNEQLSDQDVLSNFAGNIDELVKSYISSFFQQKKMYCGGTVSDKILHEKRYISLVTNTDIAVSVVTAYQMLAQEETSKKDVPEGTVTEDIKFVISILNHAATLRIPKVLAGGLLLMYLELCVGLEMNELVNPPMEEQFGYS